MVTSVQTGGLRAGEFAGYTAVTPIHTGLHSGVFRAREETTGRPVALKVLSVDGVTARALDAFARESAVLAALSAHPNIVTLFRSFALPDRRPVLVLELCRGSLEQRLRARIRISPQDSVSTAIKVAGALETAHRGGVLHRDVRPANILISEFGEPALADFGVASLRSSVSAPAELFDFPSVHVAPELIMGQRASEATDVYGLASSLYEMLAGQQALAAYAGESPAASILRILRDPARPIFRDDVPLELSDLVLWGLAKDAADRPPSVAWFAEELGRIEAGNSWSRTRNLVREPASPVQPPARRRATYSRPATVRAPSGPATAPSAPTRPAAPDPPQWTPPPATPRVAAEQAHASVRPRLVLRAPLLSAMGPLLAIAGPTWAVVIAVLAITGPGTAVVLWTLAGATLLTALASWFARPTLVIESCHLHHRDGLARVLIPWSAVLALKQQYEPSRRPGAPHGLVVVVGRYATLPLAATRRSAWKLPDLLALLDAFRRADASHRHGDERGA